LKNTTIEIIDGIIYIKYIYISYQNTKHEHKIVLRFNSFVGLLESSYKNDNKIWLHYTKLAKWHLNSVDDFNTYNAISIISKKINL